MVLDILGAGGMSSDKSDVDDSGYRAKTMAWRDKKILQKLTNIDSDCNIMNAYGNTRAGNAPWVQKRCGGRETTRKAIPGLPLNFYDPGWYASLTPGQKREIAAKKERPVLSNMD